jgi:hypothetical protein
LVTVEIDQHSVAEIGRAQRRIEAAMLALEPSSTAGRALRDATHDLFRYMQSITHVITGRLRNSEYTYVNLVPNDAYGGIATNLSYSVYEEARGGAHAFMRRTETERGPEVVDRMRQTIEIGVKQAFERTP